MGFSKQEYWSGWPFPSPGDPPHPGMETGSLALQADSTDWGTREVERRLSAKEWILQTVVLEKTLQNPLDSKIKLVNPKGNQPWIFTERTDAEALILWPPDAKSQFTGKDPDAGKDWWQEEKGTTEDEMVGWHHWLNGHVFEQTVGDGEGQGSLACCSSWGPEELDMTEELNNHLLKIGKFGHRNTYGGKTMWRDKGSRQGMKLPSTKKPIPLTFWSPAPEPWDNAFLLLKPLFCDTQFVILCFGSPSKSIRMIFL